MAYLNKSLVSLRDLTKEDILYILAAAKSLKESPRRLLEGKILATLFYEPSTRTRLSFETAMERLGGSVVGFADPKTSSATKGESLRDTAKIVSGYADILVMRHPLDGAARLLEQHATKPVINAGDGSNQHPTQMLLDLFSIQETQGTLENLTVAIVGDLKYGRTAHSLAEALALFNCTLIFVSPKQLRMPEYIKERVKHTETEDLAQAIPQADIIYMTRIQRERFPDLEEYEQVKGCYVLTKNLLTCAKTNMKVMHPLPRVDEIAIDVDTTEHAYYFQQAENGIPTRQALLCLALGVVPYE